MGPSGAVQGGPCSYRRPGETHLARTVSYGPCVCVCVCVHHSHANAVYTCMWINVKIGTCLGLDAEQSCFNIYIYICQATKKLGMKIMNLEISTT